MKMKWLMAGAASAFMAVVATASFAHAGSTLAVGDTLDVQYNFPGYGDVYSDSGDFTYTGAGQSISTQSGLTTVILSDDQIVFSDAGCADGCEQTPSGWNGPVVFDLSNGSAFDGWKVLSDTVGITSSVLGGGVAGVNWQGAFPNGGEVVVGGAVPEPTTWAMMLVGFAGLGAAMRSRRKLGLAVA
jgi:hypothetical protein